MQLATFLVPMQAKGIPYSPLTALDRLKAGLLDAFGGWTCLGETYGAWQADDGHVEYDVCKRFQVGVPDAAAVSKLQALLADLAAEMGQDSIWLTVQAVDGGCVDARKD